MDTSNIMAQLSEPLNIEDVDFRIQSINKGGYATILAYKDARVDMNRLDAVCGVNWQDKYELIDGQLFCSIGIKIDGDWIWRQDVGEESFTEKTKGRASDAFKRAGFRWGIGRELYDYPLIQIKLNPNEFKIEDGRVRQTFDLKLREWSWKVEFENKKIKSLQAFDEKGVTRFDFPNGKVTTYTPEPVSKPTQSTEKELPWLNVMDKEKSFTPQWTNVVQAINEGKITSVNDVRKYYRVSKETAEKIENQLNNKTT